MSDTPAREQYAVRVSQLPPATGLTPSVALVGIQDGLTTVQVSLDAVVDSLPGNIQQSAAIAAAAAAEEVLDSKAPLDTPTFTGIATSPQIAVRSESPSTVPFQIYSSSTTPTTDLFRVGSPTGSNVYTRIDKTGHIGVNVAPTNALFYAGGGTGTLTDNVSTGASMGLKVKIDTVAAGGVDGIQSNVNSIAGTTTSRQIRAVLGRLDIADTAANGDAVAIWGDSVVTSPTQRNVWGANIYTNLGAINSPTGNVLEITSAAIGAEIGVHTYATNSNDPSTNTVGVTLTSGSPTATVSQVGGYTDGASIAGTGIPGGTTIVSGSGTTTLTLSANATASGTIAAEIGARANYGGPLHLVANGANNLRFGLLISGGGNPSTLGVNSAQSIQHFIMATDDGGYVPGRGPSKNLLYFGPMNAGNVPAGTPKAVWDRFGWLGLGVEPSTSSIYSATGGVPSTNGGLVVAGPALFNGGLISANATVGIGYGAGAGGSVTQLTSKSTAVTLNKPAGQVITASSSLAAGAAAIFAVNDSFIDNTDHVTAHLISGQATPGSYRVEIDSIANGSFSIRVTNITAGALAEVLTIGFLIMKATIA